MRRIILILALITVSLTTGFSNDATAQTYFALKSQMTTKIASIENSVNQIESRNLITIESSKIEEEIEQHAMEAKKAFDMVIQELQTYVESSGRSGNINMARDFEDYIKPQQQRAELISKRLATIEGRVRIGRIRVTDEVINNFSTDELLEFRRSLTPNTIRMYRQRLPNKFPATIGFNNGEQDNMLCEAFPSFFNQYRDRSVLNDLFFYLTEFDRMITPEANAVVGSTIYACCTAGLLACAGCIAGAPSTADGLWNVFQSCKNSCCRCKWYKPWCCVCKAICWTVFLAGLA